MWRESSWPSQVGSATWVLQHQWIAKMTLIAQSHSLPLWLTLIHSQSQSLADNTPTEQFTDKIQVKSKKKTIQWESMISDIRSEAHANLQYDMSLAQEHWASSWLTALHNQEHIFALQKGSFRNALALCYGWQPIASHLPSNCVWSSFIIEHAMSCTKGGFHTHSDILKSEIWLLLCLQSSAMK